MMMIFVKFYYEILIHKNVILTNFLFKNFHQDLFHITDNHSILLYIIIINNFKIIIYFYYQMYIKLN